MAKIMKKVVIKIGRSIATSKRNKIDTYRFEHLAMQIKLLHEQNISVVLVISAAVCCGEQELGLKGHYDTAKSLVAGVGQITVITALYSIFKKHALKIGQLLVTKTDLQDQKKRINIKTVLNQAFEQKITVLINENDIVELHCFDGNDYLACEIAEIAGADTLLLLTDVEGVLDEQKVVMRSYTQDKKITLLPKIDHKGEIGEMKAKLDAALTAVSYGIETWITYGRTKKLFVRMLLHNEHIGTRVLGGMQ